MSYRVVKHVLAIDPAKLKPTAKRFVLTVLAEHADPDGSNAFPALPRLARQTGLSEDQAYHWRRELREEGWITVTKRTRHYTVYALNLPMIEAAKFNPDSGPAQSHSENPDSGPAQVQTLGQHRVSLCAEPNPDSVPTQSNSSLLVPDSSLDSPTPTSGVRVSVSRDESAETEEEEVTFTDEEMFAWCLTELHRGSAEGAVTKKTLDTVAGLVKPLLTEGYQPWDIAGVVDWCCRAQEKQPTRFLLKNLRAILQAENFDTLYSEAGKRMTLVTADEIKRLETLTLPVRMEVVRQIGWARRTATITVTVNREWLETQITEAIETTKENAA